MARVFAQDIIEVAVISTLAGRPHVNVLHLHNDEAASSDADKVRDFADNWQDHILTIVTDELVLQSFEWRSLDPDDQNVGTLVPDPAKNMQGTTAANTMPPNVSWLIKKGTPNRPRGRRDGRIFLGGVSEASVEDDGSVPLATVASVNQILEDFVNGVNDDAFGLGGGSGLAVLETTPESRAPGTAEVTVGWRPVTSLTLDARVATQRDRLR